jgi:hypothetical protein
MKKNLIELLKAFAVVAGFLILFGYFIKPANAATLNPTSSLDRPEIIGYIENDANGYITLTSSQVDCPEGKLFFYAVAAGGKVVGGGCYGVVGTNIMATWRDDDSMWQYPGSAIRFTQEWLDYKK